MHITPALRVSAACGEKPAFKARKLKSKALPPMDLIRHWKISSQGTKRESTAHQRVSTSPWEGLLTPQEDPQGMS